MPLHSRHGKSGTRLHRIWKSMKQRCYYKNHIAYKNYGGRGITVCEQWKNDFQSFYDWSVANGYSDNLTIDRIDTNGSYCPENCRWATWKEQEQNRRKGKRNHLFVKIGEENLTITQWAEITGIPKTLIYCRYYHGKRGDELLIPPKHRCKRSEP